MPREDIERSFAGLRSGAYTITSPASPAYNCAAWAAGETGRCWDPALTEGNFWPLGVPRELSLTNLTASFATLGFTVSDTPDLEVGIEKLALYADEHGLPTHMARQLPSGAWTSKLGVSEDIEHETLAALEGPIYGKIARLLRRRRPAG
jgi:hypothetical protein